MTELGQQRLWSESPITADGLPVGIQVIGDRFTDLRCLDVAAQIEAAADPVLPIDPVTE